MKIRIQLPVLKQLHFQDDTWILSPSHNQEAGTTLEAGAVCYLRLKGTPSTPDPALPHIHLNTHMGLSKGPWVGSGKPPPESLS